MRAELDRNRHYDILNSEKMTPRFLTLMRIKKVNANLDSICDAEGNEFQSNKTRLDYICSFYQDIYKQPVGGQLDENSITNFLGPEICSNPIVEGLKLTREESEFFDRPITLQEYDKAILGLNEKSAGGLDGISTKFLKIYWMYFRTPLFRYANHCFNTGKLTQSFYSAGIRLIPKKGDTKQIKNWRPISLLNSIFKIISKAIDNRLDKINEIIISRAQKGFTKNRYIHECLINIIDTVGYCEVNKIPAFALALDMAKAFDTVRHDYVNLAYEFFGIGTQFIKVLNTISTGRTPHIIIDDGSTSKGIKLGTGFPQGNAPSAKQFNVSGQTLIIKIEFDPRIRAIFELNLNLPDPGIVHQRLAVGMGPDPGPGPGPGPAPPPDVGGRPGPGPDLAADGLPDPGGIRIRTGVRVRIRLWLRRRSGTSVLIITMYQGQLGRTRSVIRLRIQDK
jgi:Reverse transcriptase (RNA-dependent DNA polymerase)